MCDFTIKAERYPGITILRLAGELDFATTDLLKREVEASPPGDTILVDLEHLTFLDAAGVGALIQERTARGGHLFLRHPRGIVLTVLTICEFIDAEQSYQSKSLGCGREKSPSLTRPGHEWEGDFRSAGTNPSELFSALGVH